MNSLTSRIILANRKKEILILKDKDSDYWGLLGGGVGSLESPAEGLVREIKEEISIELVYGLKLAGIEYRKDDKNSEIIFVFDGGILSDRDIGKIKPANEIGETRFMNILKAYEFLTPNMVRRLKLILSKTENGIVYLENGQKI